MILILTDKDEPTTDFVIDWLNYLEKNFVRISYEDKLDIKSIYITDNGLEATFEYLNDSQKITLDTKDISSYWYRRSSLGWGFEEMSTEDEEINEVLNSYLLEEHSSATKMLNVILNSKSKINAFDDNSLLKLDVLQLAQKNGLKIPDSLLCCSKKDLLEFNQMHSGNIITKSLGDPTSFFHKNLHQFTTKIEIDEMPDTFGISLFQEMIQKVVELRIYFLNDSYYGSAIFSQMSDQTKMDLKHYDLDKPNRVVPYTIPGEIKNQLKSLMNDLNLNSGSIDMIVNEKLEYIFLEVNPIGQFEQVAVPCNQDLFKLVAETL